MADIELTAGDTRPRLQASLKNYNGEAANLTGADVELVVREQYSEDVLFEKAVTVTDASNGVVEYQWDSADTSEAGYYEAKFRVTFGADTSDPNVQHFPNDDSILIAIE